MLLFRLFKQQCVHVACRQCPETAQCIAQFAVCSANSVSTAQCNITSYVKPLSLRAQVGDVVCEIELEQFSVGVKVETPGYLAEICESRHTT